MARLLQPLIQGDLDGLCGLYSLLNAAQWALYSFSRASAKTPRLPKLLSDFEQQDLFEIFGYGTWPAPTTRHLRHRRHTRFRADAATAR